MTSRTQLESQDSENKTIRINNILSKSLEKNLSKIRDLEEKHADLEAKNKELEQKTKEQEKAFEKIADRKDEEYNLLKQRFEKGGEQKLRVVKERKENEAKVTQLEKDIEKMKQEKVKVVAENIIVLEEKDTLIADLMKKLKEQVGSSPSKEEVAKLKGQQRNTHRREKYAYEKENEGLTKMLADSQDVVKNLKSEVVNLKEGLSQKEGWVETLTKRMDNEDLLKEKILDLQKLSNYVWTLSRYYLKVFKKMGAQKLSLKDAFEGLKPTVKRMTSPGFVTTTVPEELVLPNLDVVLKEAKEMLEGFESTFISNKKEAAEDKKRRHPSDSSGTTSSSSSEAEYGEPTRKVRKNGRSQ